MPSCFNGLIRGLDKRGLLNRRAISRLALFAAILGFFLLNTLFSCNSVFGGSYWSEGCVGCQSGRSCACTRFTDDICDDVFNTYFASVNAYYTSAGCTVGTICTNNVGYCNTADHCYNNVMYSDMGCVTDCTSHQNAQWTGCAVNCRDSVQWCTGSTGPSACSGTCYWSGSTSYCGNNDTVQTICEGCGELWIASNCCGDDGTEDYASSDGANYCCNGASQADDTWCDATWGWQIDGSQCQNDVVDNDGSWTPPTADNDLVCACDTTGITSGNPCTTDYANTGVDGICAHTATTGRDCDAADVAYNTTFYVSCNINSDGRQCDTVTSGGSYLQDSMCLSDTNNGGSYDCKTDGTADHACFDGSYYEDTCASCSDTNGCDTSLTSGDFSAGGICLTDNTCDTTTHACNDDGTYEASCATCGQTTADHDPCDDITDGSFSASGMCVSGDTCDTGEVCAAAAGGTVYDSCQNVNCDPVAEFHCMTDAGNDGSSWNSNGICTGAAGVESCDDSGDACFDDARYQSSCASCSQTTSDPDACDPIISDGDYSASGMCVSGGACDGGEICAAAAGGTIYSDCTNANCDPVAEFHCMTDADNSGSGSWTSSGICTGAAASEICDDTGDACFDDARYQASCSSCGQTVADNDACDADVSDGDYTSAGICVSGNSCDVNGDICSDDQASGTLYSDCSNAACEDGNACMSGAATSFTRNGRCAGDGNCCTDDYDNDGADSCGCDDAGDYDATPVTCDTAPADGSTMDGLCVSDSTTCDTGEIAQCSSTTRADCSNCGSASVFQCMSDAANDGSGWAAGGICTDTTDCTLNGNPVYNDEGTYKAGCSGGAASDVDPCDSAIAAAAYSAEGMCVSPGSCYTAGVYLSGGNVITADCNPGSQCIDDTTNDGSLTSWSQTGTCLDASTCDTTTHLCYTGAAYQADCTSCSEADTCDSDATAGGDYSANGDCFDDDGSMICCYGTMDRNDTVGGSSCCYDGDVKTNDWNSASVLCLNGGLYDCGSQVSIDQEANANYCSNPEGDNFWCGYGNTWEATRIAADCCPIVDGDQDSAGCPVVNGEEWNHGSTSGDCTVNKWLIGDYNDAGSDSDDVWGVWAQNNTYWFYILLNVSSGTPEGNLRIYFDTDEDTVYECYVDSTGIYQSSDDEPCTGGSAGSYATANNYAEYQIDLDDYICDTCCGGSSGDCGANTRIYIEDPDAGDERAPNSSYAEYDFSCGGGGPSAPIPEFPFGAIVAFVILLIMTALFAPKSL